jgi:hypothetical protein
MVLDQYKTIEPTEDALLHVAGYNCIYMLNIKLFNLTLFGHIKFKIKLVRLEQTFTFVTLSNNESEILVAILRSNYPKRKI